MDDAAWVVAISGMTLVVKVIGDRITSVEHGFDARTDALAGGLGGRIDALADGLGARLGAVATRMSSLETRMNSMEGAVRDVGRRVTALEVSVGKH